MSEEYKGDNQMDTKQIYNKLLPEIKRIYRLFSYLGMTKNEFNSLVLREIENYKINSLNDDKNINSIIKKIELMLIEKTKLLLSDDITAFNIINRFVNISFKHLSNYREAIKYFDDLEAFLDIINFNISLEMINKLLDKNKLYLNVVQEIFKQYEVEIINDGSKRIFTNKTLIKSLEIYCLVSGIGIKNYQRECNYLDDYLDDNIKIYLNDIGNRKSLSFENEVLLKKEIIQGNEKARALFIESNLRLVTIIAKQYIGKGVDYLDLVQEGNIGLMKAIEKYDYSLGYRFSTYASYWINRYMRNAINTYSRNIRLPLDMCEKIRIFKNEKMILKHKLNREPLIKEIAEEMGISIKMATKLYNYQQTEISFNTVVYDNDVELQDIFLSEELDLDNLYFEKEMQYQIKEILDNCNFTEQEIDILFHRYGLNGQKVMTLKELSEKHGVSHQRISQIEAKIIAKIRQEKELKQLIIYADNPDKAMANIEASYKFKRVHRKSC